MVAKGQRVVCTLLVYRLFFTPFSVLYFLPFSVASSHCKPIR